MYSFEYVKFEELGKLERLFNDFVNNVPNVEVNIGVLGLVKDDVQVGYVMFSNASIGVYLFKDNDILKRYVYIDDETINCVIDGYCYSVGENYAMVSSIADKTSYILCMEDNDMYSYCISTDNKNVIRVYDGNIISDDHVKEIIFADKDVNAVYSYSKMIVEPETFGYTLFQLLESSNIVDFIVKMLNPNSPNVVFNTGLSWYNGGSNVHYARYTNKIIPSLEKLYIYFNNKLLISQSEFLVRYSNSKFPPHFKDLINGNFEEYNNLLDIYSAIYELLEPEENQKLTKNRDK